MAFLHQQIPSRSRKRPSSSVSDLSKPQDEDVMDKMVKILAEAGCTLLNPSGSPSLPSDLQKFRRHLTHLFSPCSSNNATALRSDFVSGFASYIETPGNLHRVLTPWTGDRSESLVRNLLLVAPIQLDLQNILLEKLPEFFDIVPETSLEDDVTRLIINHFRWLDFVVDPVAFSERLMQVLSICPLYLKKEIIGSLPEIIGDHNNKSLIDSLERMLQEDSAITVPVLDSLSSINLDAQSQDQVITIALSCIRTIDAEQLPYLLRFLMLSATPANVPRVISQIREQLKFVGISSSRATQRKLKGKSPIKNTEASVLDALGSSLRFKNLLCQEILKQLNNLDKPRDHKVIDIWLLMLMYMKGEPLRRTIEKTFKKKIVQECIQEIMVDQCICGNKELVQDYFSSFLSLAEFLLGCKEQKARAFGSHLYTSLFEEFVGTYSRQEILGSLVTHVGSGVNFEVSSALETMTLLSTKYAQELFQFSSHISGILDYLEGFSVENLHKVYEVFSPLTLSAQTSPDCFRSSIANELLMIVRKQVSHPDLKYKKMGLIGTIKIVSCLADASNVTQSSHSKELNCKEALELLKTSLDSCRQLCLPLTLFYDELTALLDHKTLQPEITEWIAKHAGEFESIFLSDLEGGKLGNEGSYCGLDGELWMNLDGAISPVCLNILPLACTSMQSASSLQILPSIFLLLSTLEKFRNQGSLAGIDALLGCPLHLPSSKYFSVAGWQSLTGKQKQIVCISLFYAANWMRELLNAFSSQVSGRFLCVTQTTKEDIITKLLKRLGNLVFLESLLNSLIKDCPLSLPELHLCVEHSGSTILSQNNYMGHLEKKNLKSKACDGSTPSMRKCKIPKASKSADASGKLKQPTILDMLGKAGATSQKDQNVDSSILPSKYRTIELEEQSSCDSNEPILVEVLMVTQALEAQRYKFRPLLAECFSILTLSKDQDFHCSDLTAMLPLQLYLLRDLHYKLDSFASTREQCTARDLTAPASFSRMTVDDFLCEIKPLFPNLKHLLSSAIHTLKEENWKLQSVGASNPSMPSMVISESSVSAMVFKEVLNCFSKMLNLREIQMDESVLSNLLEAFQPLNLSDARFSGIQVIPSPGTTEYLYLGACSFLEDVLNIACSLSFMLASECLVALESVATTANKFLAKEENGKKTCSKSLEGLLPIFRRKLRTSAQRLLEQNWSDESLENGWKNKGELVQKTLQIYLQTAESTSDVLDELTCSILPQMSASTSIVEDDHHSFPALCPATFVVWYRVLHEVNLTILNKQVKELCLEKRQAGGQSSTVETHLINIHKTVNVVVSLVNMCRTHDKVTVHAMAVKYGGKFVDSFLKVFYFFQAHFQSHNEVAIQLVKELQKATRTMQTLCSEAKGSKQTVITSKVPATKRSLERFLFRVKALLHTTSSGCSFWMGNLKHKDLTGQVVSSQAYVDNQNDDVNDDPAGAIDENESASVASEDR
ncbi:Fanconi anemia group D2 protein isoform X2 [Carica papaya]|uniref:Fanconi anemia group D2 protein isoform X2 n=1 Tax=Carica papaya TaxID=3649 RepID=UPI000B8CD42C|nr:Fanconi anemia group D2 protein isoform X2 [Carica papaya]